MRKLQVVGASLLLIAGVVTVMCHRGKDSQSNSPGPDEAKSSTDPERHMKPVANHVIPRTKDLPQPRTEPTQPSKTVPPQVPASPLAASFYDLSEGDQLRYVTELQTQTYLPADVRTLLRSALLDKRLNETVRNNIANGLLAQSQRDESLVGALIAMIDDPTETDRWREYAVQHLALTFPDSPQKALIEATLWNLLSSSQPGLPGTVMILLERLNAKGALAIEGERFDAALLNAATRYEADIASAISAVGILAERKSTGALPTLRRLAVAPAPAIRRTAIAALGTIGDQTDGDLIAASIKDEDRSVSMAATAAFARLNKR